MGDVVLLPLAGDTMGMEGPELLALLKVCIADARNRLAILQRDRGDAVVAADWEWVRTIDQEIHLLNFLEVKHHFNRQRVLEDFVLA